MTELKNNSLRTITDLLDFVEQVNLHHAFINKFNFNTFDKELIYWHLRVKNTKNTNLFDVIITDDGYVSNNEGFIDAVKSIGNELDCIKFKELTGKDSISTWLYEKIFNTKITFDKYGISQSFRCGDIDIYIHYKLCSTSDWGL